MSKNKNFTLNMVMFLKGITLIPKSILTMSATLLSLDGNILQHYITRKDVVGLKKDTDIKNQDTRFTKTKMYKDSDNSDKDNDNNKKTNTFSMEDDVDDVPKPADDKLNWENSLKKCFDESLGLHKLYLTIMAKRDNSVTKSGDTISHEIRFGRNDLFSFSGSILEKCIKETSLATYNGNRFVTWHLMAMACILSGKDSTNLSGPDNLDPQEQIISEDDDRDDNSNEDNELHKEYTNIFDRDIYFTYKEESNMANNSDDVSFLEDGNIVDSCMDRSYMFLGFCVNLLYTLRAIVQRLKHVSPTDVDPTLLTRIDELQAKKNGVPPNPEGHSVLGDNIRKEVTEIKLNPGGKSCEVITRLRRVRNSVGIWGSDCLFIDYIGSLRKLKKSGSSGFDTVMDITNEDHFGVFTTVNNPSPSSFSGTDQENNVKRMEEQDLEAKLLSDLDFHISTMCAERNGYCTATLKVVQNVYREFSKYARDCHKKYTDFMNSQVYLENSFKTKFKEKVRSSDYSRNMTLRHSDSNHKKVDIDQIYDEDPDDDAHILRYRGSIEYEKKRDLHQELRKVILKLMIDDEYIPYFGEHLSPTSEKQCLINGNGGSLWYRCFTNKILPTFCKSFGSFLSTEVKITDFNQPENGMQVDTDCGKKDECGDFIDNSDESVTVLKQLQQLKLDYMYSYVQHTDVIQHITCNKTNEPFIPKVFNIFCVFGIPEVILLDEECLIKWISLVVKSKTDPNSLAFKNPKNKNLPTLCCLISTAWRAKSTIMMKEYTNISDTYDNKYFTPVVLGSFQKNTQ